MTKISNKTIFGLLTLVIVLSLAGTFISLNKLGQLNIITGLQANQTTQSGQTAVTILGAAQITLYNATMNFGSGQVNGTPAGHDFCVLQSNASINPAGNIFTSSALGTGSKSTACVGSNWLIPWSFVIENTGNSPFTNVTMNSSGGNVGFQQTFSSAVANGTWTYRFDEEGSGACTENYDGSYNTFPGLSPVAVCSNFQAAGSDAFIIQVNVTLPEDSAPNNWQDSVTFIGNV